MKIFSNHKYFKTLLHQILDLYMVIYIDLIFSNPIKHINPINISIESLLIQFLDYVKVSVSKNLNLKILNILLSRVTYLISMSIIEKISVVLFFRMVNSHTQTHIVTAVTSIKSNVIQQQNYIHKHILLTMM